MERGVYRDILARIYEQEWRIMVGHAVKRGYDKEDAYDAVNEKFMALLERNEPHWMLSFISKDSRHQTAYIYTAVMNRLSDTARRASVGREKEQERYDAEQALHYGRLEKLKAKSI